MIQKKILIVGNSFYPNNDPRSLRTTALAKEFSIMGHDVTVLTPKKETVHKQFEIKHGVQIKDLGKSSFKEIGVASGNKITLLFKRVVKRILNYFFDYPYVEWMFKVKRKLKEESGYDLLITIAFPHAIHWGTAWAWRAKNKIAKTWVADCGDPFMGTENDSFKKIFYFKYLEKNWGKKVDYITIPMEEARTAYYPEFQDKIRIIPQGFSFPELTLVKKNNKIPTFLYSGNIGSYLHNYTPFFNLLNSINEDFKFIVFTKEKHIYKRYLNKVLDKVEINDYVEREKLITQMQEVDFLIHFPYTNHSQKSLKLVDYSYSGTPILSYKGKEDNPNVLQFLRGDYTTQYPSESIAPYKIENVCNQFLTLIDGTKD